MWKSIKLKWTCTWNCFLHLKEKLKESVVSGWLISWPDSTLGGPAGWWRSSFHSPCHVPLIFVPNTLIFVPSTSIDVPKAIIICPCLPNWYATNQAFYASTTCYPQMKLGMFIHNLPKTIFYYLVFCPTTEEKKYTLFKSMFNIWFFGLLWARFLCS